MSAVPVGLPTKSAEAFRTISEVATELDVPQHVLRFWETRFAQIRPLKRAGGRRYYRPEDVDLLRGIRALLYRDGYTIKGVQKILREQGLRHVADVGRQAPVSRAQVRRAAATETDHTPRHARAVIARVHEAHADLLSPAQAKPELDKAARAKLEKLLKELLHMKKQLHTARDHAHV
jgi:DNA-binding transcriptional MerR regulator